MLDPRDRTLLLDALRPPDGYELDFAVGTTYSLDLMALLAAPLAFTLFDWEDREGRVTADPLVLLEALRTQAGRITVFCQAGRIAVPATHRPLFGYLENSVVEVGAPHPEGAFHPKMWALRYIAEDRPATYRVLCLSRNLTFDRSWDTVLVLEGELVNRKNAFTVNHPIGEFFEALPGMASRSVTDEVSSRVNRLQHEIRRVRFVPPYGFDGYEFWPFGLGSNARWPFNAYDRRLLVVAPFVSESVLRRLTEERIGGSILVSREESLDRISPATLERFDSVYSMATEAETEGETEEAADDGNLDVLRGLHAKLFVMDDGWDARLWTGSANATHAAFSRNVEFLVELTGKKSVCGIDAVIGGSDTQTSLASLLLPYRPPDEPPGSEEHNLESIVEGVRREISGLDLRLVAKKGGTDQTWTLEVSRRRGRAIKLPVGCELYCRPLSIHEGTAMPFNPSAKPAARFEGLSWQALTSFVVFSVVVREGKNEARVVFVRNLLLEGGPTDRYERMIEQVLTDEATVMRFLLLLLAQDQNDLAAVQSSFGQKEGLDAGRLDLQLGMPLFEALVQSLARSPERLDRVARLVDELAASESGRALLPEGFNSIWEPIWEARRRASRG